MSLFIHFSLRGYLWLYVSVDDLGLVQFCESLEQLTTDVPGR